MDASYFTNLRNLNYIKLIDYYFKECNYKKLELYAVCGNITYCAEINFIKQLKQEAMNKIIKTSGMQNFSNIVVYLSDKCTEYNLQDEYLNYLNYAKKYFLKQEEKKIDDIILTEATRIKVEKEEQQKLILEKEQKKDKIKKYTKQIEKNKEKIKSLEKELEV